MKEQKGDGFPLYLGILYLFKIDLRGSGPRILTNNFIRQEKKPAHIVNQVVHADGKSRTNKANTANLEPLSPVFAPCKHVLHLHPNFAPRFVRALLMPVERLTPIRPVLPLVRQKLLLHKLIDQTSTVSAVCIQIRARCFASNKSSKT